jgi:hypothetical protein
VNLINIGLLQVGVATLPTDGVEQDNETKDAETGGAAPVDEWVAKEKILDDCAVLAKVHLQTTMRGLTVVVPSAHAETNMEKRPLPE